MIYLWSEKRNFLANNFGPCFSRYDLTKPLTSLCDSLKYSMIMAAEREAFTQLRDQFTTILDAKLRS